jgi:hypothetical protein
MKPTNQISSNERDSNPRHGHRNFPLTDYSYQTPAEVVSGSSAIAQEEIAHHLRTFRQISREFFGAEANREYVAEAIFFSCISLVAAWPVGVMIRQLITMMI